MQPIKCVGLIPQPIHLIECYNWFSWISETFLVGGSQEPKTITFGDVSVGIADNFNSIDNIYIKQKK